MRRVIAIAAVLLAGCGEVASTPSSLVEKAREYVRRGDAVLVDVRSQEEWDAGHLAGAVFVPITSLEGDDAAFAAAAIPTDKTVYTYCKAGGRAGRAVPLLEAAGVKAIPLAEGFEELKAAGFETE